MQLLETYAALAWGKNNKTLEGIRDSSLFSLSLFLFRKFIGCIKCRIIRSAEETRAATQEVNRKRKFSQTEAGEQLLELNQKWHALVQRNIEIIQACKAIQDQVKEKQSEAFWNRTDVLVNDNVIELNHAGSPTACNVAMNPDGSPMDEV